MSECRKSCGRRARTYTKSSHANVLDVSFLTSRDTSFPLSEGTDLMSLNRDNHADKKGRREIVFGLHWIFTREVRTH